VRVTTTTDGQSQSYIVELEYEGPLWKAVKRTPASG